MHFLLVLDSVEAPAAANPRLARRLAAQLAALGHRVHLLELWDGETPPPAPPAGVPCTLLPFADERLMNAALENGARGGSPLPLRLARLAAHPTAAAAAFRQLVLRRPRRTVDTRRAIERLDAEHHFDAVCAVCAPYRSAFALEQARIGGKKLLWQLDPYAANRDYTAPGGFAREGALLGRVDLAYITAQAVADYAPGAPLAPWQGKTRVLGFPNLVPPAPCAPQPRQGGGTRCVFCGTLYPGLREPGYALALFSALQGAELVMVGGGWQHFARQADAARAAMGPRAQLSGPVPPGRAAALQAGADVLLSLGNTADNQLPSKLFDYFSTGKPVLHLAVAGADPALPYLARYPLALVLHAQGTPDAATVGLAQRWLASVRGKALPFEQVAALYPGFTPGQVAQDFLAPLT